MYIIYCYRNKINNKKYIGITKRSLKQRQINHVSEAYNKKCEKYNTPFKQAIRKYGIEGFELSVLEKVNTLDEANEREMFYIKKYNSYCYAKNGWGYNATEGGEGVKRKIHQIVQLDKYNANLINVFDSISDAEKELNIGHISECLYDKIPSIGGYCWMFKDQYDKMTIKELYDYIQIKNKRIVQLTKKMELIQIWDNIMDIERELKISNSAIVSAYKGNRKTLKGFVWRTYYDYINNITPIPTKTIIYQLDEFKNIINTYNFIKEASIVINVSPQVLGRHINTNKTYKGYYWIKKEVNKNELS